MITKKEVAKLHSPDNQIENSTVQEFKKKKKACSVINPAKPRTRYNQQRKKEKKTLEDLREFEKGALPEIGIADIEDKLLGR